MESQSRHKFWWFSLAETNKDKLDSLPGVGKSNKWTESLYQLMIISLSLSLPLCNLILGVPTKIPLIHRTRTLFGELETRNRCFFCCLLRHYFQDSLFTREDIEFPRTINDEKGSRIFFRMKNDCRFCKDSKDEFL